MKSEVWKKRSFGYILILLSISVIVAAFSISVPGFGGNSDPGPALLPILLAAFLFVAGVIDVWRQAKRPSEERGDDENAGAIAADRMLALKVLISFFGFIGAIPLLGFLISGGVFSIVAMRLFGVGWKLAIPVSIGLLLFVNFLFGFVFRVPLPRGPFNLPF